MSRLSLLVVTAAPDDRPSTTTLRDVVAEIRRRPQVDVHLWYLRDGGREPADADRIVDHLREEEPGSTLDRFGLVRPAGLLRGRRLRHWWRDAAPTWVLLDDGLGGRLLDAAGGPVRTVVRLNCEGPDDAPLEPPPAREADLVLCGDSTDPDTVRARRRLDLPQLRDHVSGRIARDPDARAATRSRLGLPTDVPVVVGWGEDPWLDGPDLLIRALWSLEHRHGTVAHGLWLGIDPDGEDGERLRDEAARCGVADRMALHPVSSSAHRLCGDAVLLPYRSTGDPLPIHEALVAGCGVVTFPVWDAEDPAVRTVGHLDVDAAAHAVVEVLEDDRLTVAARAEQRYDVGPWVDRFLAELRDLT